MKYAGGPGLIRGGSWISLAAALSTTLLAVRPVVAAPESASATVRVEADTLTKRALADRSDSLGDRRVARTRDFGLPAHGLDFDDDYSTILAGLPMARPTHAHGEGDAELGPLIPELASDVQYRSGPSYVETGDQGSAGTTTIRYSPVLSAPLVVVSGGQQGYRRVLLAHPIPMPSGTAFGAVEREQRDGPWTTPEDNRKTNGILQYHTSGNGRALEIAAIGYDDRWTATNQVPERSIRSGRIARFGSIDPSDGGKTGRYGVSAGYQEGDDRNSTRLSGYLFAYRLDLFTNFTYFLADTVHGDQFEQTDRRWVAGIHAAHAVIDDWFSGSVVQTIGVDVRHDQISELGIYNTEARNRLRMLRRDRGRITSVSPYVESDAAWMRGVRTIVGARAEGFAFDDVAGDPTLSGNGFDGTVSPKAAVLLGPWAGFVLSAGAGFGVHSEDMRGASGSTGSPVTASSGVESAPEHIPTSGGASTRTTPLLIHTRGADVGVRYAHDERSSLALTFWGFEMAAEHVFLGDQVTLSQSRPSRREGVDLSAGTRLAGCVHLEADASYARARFTNATPAGDFIPGAIEGTAAGRMTYARARGFLAGLQVRYQGPRPLLQDDSVRASSAVFADLQAGFRSRSKWKGEVSVENLFDRAADDEVFYYVSRLPNESPAGIADLHRHPAGPRAVRLTISWGATD